MRFVLALLVITALSGCFGLPEGAADFGDDVSIEYVVLHAETGMPLVWALDDVFTTDAGGLVMYDGTSLRANLNTQLSGIPADLAGFFVQEAANRYAPVDKAAFDAAVIQGGHVAHLGISKEFTMGSGTSGLGFDIERGIIGMVPDQTRTIVSESDRTRDYGTEVTRERWLGPAEQMTQDIDRALFEQNLGTPTVGQTFQMTQSFQAEVTSFDNTTVNARLIVADSYPADVVGGTVMPRVTGDEFRLELVLTPGMEFDIVSSAFQAAPLDLADGSYQSIGTRGDMVVWTYTASPAAVIGVPIEVHVTMKSVTQTAIMPDEDNLAGGVSPVLPRTAGSFAEAESHDHGDDGHGADGHTH